MTAGSPLPMRPSAPAPDVRPRERWPRGLRALRHRNFRLFWFGHLVSLVGTWMQNVAQAWLVLELTGDPLALGLVVVFQSGPGMILGLLGGLIADVWPKRRTLALTQASALVLAVALGGLSATGLVEVWHVYLLAALLGVVNAVDMPVRQSFVVEMVGREDVANAVGLNSAIFNGARIVGPAVAGLAIAAVGVASAFFVNALTYVAILVAVALMRTDELAAAPRTVLERSVAGVVEPLVDGLRYVRRTRIVLLAITVLGTVATFSFNFQTLLPLYARELGGQAETYGFLTSASGVGSLVAALFIAFTGRPTVRLLIVGALALGGAIAALSFTASLPVALGLLVVAGWGGIAMAATTNTLIQLMVPDDLRGRVMSVYTTVFVSSGPIGGIFSGALAAVGGVRAALLVGGVAAILATLLAVVRLPVSGDRALSEARADPNVARPQPRRGAG